MAQPTLVDHYEVYANANNASTLTTPSFTPSDGEVVVVKSGTWDTGTPMGAPTGGDQTFTEAVINAPGGFMSWCGIYTAVISGSPGPMTISATPAASCWHSMVVERWSGAQLADTPATGTGAGNGTTPSATVTTTADDSVVSWVNGDINSRDPSSRAYLSGATEDGLQDGHSGSNSVTYYAYQAAATAGSQTMGMSAPASQRWVLAGVEIQAAESANTGTISAALPAPTGALSGEVVADATLNATLPAPTGALSGGVVADATLDTALPALAGDLAASVIADATLTGALPALTGSLAGSMPELVRAIRVDVHGPAVRAAPELSGPAVRRTVDGPAVRRTVDGIGV